MPVSFVAVRQGSATLSSSKLMIVSVSISVFEFHVEENKFLEIAGGKKSLVDFSTPLFGRIGVEVPGKIDINAPRVGPLSDTRRCPSDRSGKGLRPLSDVRVVKLVGRHEMPKRPEPPQRVRQSIVKLNRRVEEEVAVCETHDGHSRRERERQLDSTYDQILERAVDDADVRPDGLVDADWLVERSAHGQMTTYS